MHQCIRVYSLRCALAGAFLLSSHTLLEAMAIAFHTRRRLRSERKSTASISPLIPGIGQRAPLSFGNLPRPKGGHVDKTSLNISLLSTAMNRGFAFWVAFLSAFLASGLALVVAFSLGLAYQVGGLLLASELSRQSKWAAVAALAALVSAIAQIIQRASK